MIYKLNLVGDAHLEIYENIYENNADVSSFNVFFVVVNVMTQCNDFGFISKFAEVISK